MLPFTSCVFICISLYLKTSSSLSVYEMDSYLAENGIQTSNGTSFDDCQFTFNEPHGNFTSVGYPEHFPKIYMECDWTIKLMAGRLTLEFKTVDLPMVIYNDRCVAAYMMYGDFTYEGHRIIHGKTCGLNPPTIFVSTTPWAWVTLIVTGQGQEFSDVLHKGLLIEYHADITEYTENQLIVATVCGLIIAACCLVPVIWYYIRKKQMKTRRLQELQDLERVRRKALMDTTVRSVAAPLVVKDATWVSPIHMSEFMRVGEEGGLSSDMFHLSEPHESKKWLSSLASFFHSPRRQSPGREILPSQESTLAAAAPMHSSDEGNDWTADLTSALKSTDSLDSVFIREQPQLLASSTPHPLAFAGLGNKLVAQRAIHGSKKKSQQSRPSLESIYETDENQQRPCLQIIPNNEGEKNNPLYLNNHKTEKNRNKLEEETVFCTPPKACIVKLGTDNVQTTGQTKNKNVTFNMTPAITISPCQQELRPEKDHLITKNGNETPQAFNKNIKNCQDKSTWDIAQETVYFECHENKELKTLQDSFIGVVKSTSNPDPSRHTTSVGLQSYEQVNTATAEMGSVTCNLEFFSSSVSPDGDTGSLHKSDLSANSSALITRNTNSEKSTTSPQPPEIYLLNSQRLESELEDDVFVAIDKDCHFTSKESPSEVHGILTRCPTISNSTGTNNSEVFKNTYERESIENPNVQGIFTTPTLEDEDILSSKCLSSGSRDDILDVESPAGATEKSEINTIDYDQNAKLDIANFNIYFDKDQNSFPQWQNENLRDIDNSTSIQSNEYMHTVANDSKEKSKSSSVDDKQESLYSEAVSSSSRIPKLSQDGSSCLAGNLLQEMVEEQNASCQRDISNTSEELCSDTSLPQPMNSSMMSNAFAILAMPSRSPSPITAVYGPLDVDNTLAQVSARIKEPQRTNDCVTSAWCPVRAEGDGSLQDEIQHLSGQAALTSALSEQNVKQKSTAKMEPDLGEAWSGEGVLLSIKNLSKFAEASCRSNLLHRCKSRERHLSAPTLNPSQTAASIAKEPKRKSDPPRSSWLISGDWSENFDFGKGSENITKDGSRRCLRGTRRIQANSSSAWTRQTNPAQRYFQRSMSLPRKTGRVHFSDNLPEYISDVWPDSGRELEISDLVGACGGGNESSKWRIHQLNLKDSGMDNSQMTSVSRLYNSSSSMSPKWGGTSIVI